MALSQKTSQVDVKKMDLNLPQCPCVYPIIYFAKIFNVKTKVYNSRLYVDYFHRYFQFLISLTYVSDVCGLMRRILYLIFVRPHCNVTVPLVQHYVIKNGTLNGFLYYNIA